MQNAAFMFSASAGGMVVQFLFMPLLSRVYDPEAYGIFGIFNSVLVILGMASMLGYNQAFVLPKTESRFRAMLSVTLRSGLLVGGVLTVLTLVAIPWLGEWKFTKDLGLWWLALGPLLILLVCDRLLLDWSIRDKAFKGQSVWSIPVTLASKGFNLGYGHFVTATADGHLLTSGLNYLLRIGVYFRWVIPNAAQRLRTRSTKSERDAIRKDFADYPRYTMWSNLLNTASNYIPVLILPLMLEDVATAAYYTFALIVLDLPVRLLSSGITPVYMNKAAEVQANRPQELGPLTFKLFRNLVVIAAVAMGLLYALGEPAYAFVFGEKWRLAGQGAEWLSIYYFFRLVSSPISPVINIVRKEHEVLHFQIGLFVMRVVSLLPGFFMDLDFVSLMLLFSIGNAISFAAFTHRVFALINYRPWAALGLAGIGFGVCFALAHLLKLAV